MVAPAITRLPGETYEEWKKRYRREYWRIPENKRRQKERDANRSPESRRRKAECEDRRLQDPEKKKCKANCSAEWHKNNPHAVAAHAAARRARKRQAQPPWVDPAELKMPHIDAERLTRETGIPHHVDHIVPLGGKNVCGLHVPWNLRVIPANENLSKGNRLTPEVLELCHSTLQETLLLSA